MTNTVSIIRTKGYKDFAKVERRKPKKIILLLQVIGTYNMENKLTIYDENN